MQTINRSPVAQGPLAGNQKKVGIEMDRREKQRVWLLKGGKPAAMPVQAGATDGTVTEIVGGELQPGAAVIVDVKDTP